MMEDNKFKKEIINEITNMLETIGKKLKNSNATIDEQMIKVDILLDTIKFLDNYDKNVEILNLYWLNENYKRKFNNKSSNKKGDKERDD